MVTIFSRLVDRRSGVALYLVGMFIMMAHLTGCSGGFGRSVLTQAQIKNNVESFDFIAKTIPEKHWDQSLGGVDWEEACRELRPRVEKARTAAKARAAMRELIDTLGQTHFSVIPAHVYEDSSRDRGNTGQAGTQIDLRLIDNKAVVVSVPPDSPSASAGVRTGWTIENIDGKKIKPPPSPDADVPNSATYRIMRYVSSVKHKMSGDVGDTIEVVFRDGDNRKVKKEIVLAEKRGHRIKFGNMPTMYTWFESRLIDGEVRYLRFNHFFDPMLVMPAFGEAVASSWDAKGMIIDLRGNGGGIGAMSMGMAGWFIEEEDVKLGTMRTRNSDLKFVINPRPRIFHGPLAVLVDGLSASTSEILAGGLQDLGRARIFGSRTAGAALPSVIERLPNGDGFQYAIANYVSEGGRVLEGEGVTPDVEVELTRETLLHGHDDVVDAAVAWIRAEAVQVK